MYTITTMLKKKLPPFYRTGTKKKSDDEESAVTQQQQHYTKTHISKPSSFNNWLIYCDVAVVNALLLYFLILVSWKMDTHGGYTHIFTVLPALVAELLAIVGLLAKSIMSGSWHVRFVYIALIVLLIGVGLTQLLMAFKMDYIWNVSYLQSSIPLLIAIAVSLFIVLLRRPCTDPIGGGGGMGTKKKFAAKKRLEICTDL